MRALDVAPRAAAELTAILAYSEASFGPAAADRYRDLINAAVEDIRDDPERLGARRFGERWLYHLRHGRSRLFGPAIGNPRHILMYRFTDQRVTLLRVLHDAMDLPARLTDDA